MLLITSIYKVLANPLIISAYPAVEFEILEWDSNIACHNFSISGVLGSSDGSSVV